MDEVVCIDVLDAVNLRLRARHSCVNADGLTRERTHQFDQC